MHTPEQMRERLSALTLARMGFDGAAVAQGTDQWHAMRLGVITASRAKELIQPSTRAPFPDDVQINTIQRGVNTVQFGGKSFTGTKAECIDFVRDLLPPIPSEGRRMYAAELVGEILCGFHDSGSFKQTEWGKMNEAEARQIFGFHVGVPIHEVPFVYGDDSMRYGCSPDGIVDEHSGAEIKCPFTPKIHAAFLMYEDIKEEYIEQCQFSMFVTGRPFWHFCSYHPKAITHSFHSVIVERDEAKMRTFADAVGQMNHDVDMALGRLGLTWGDHWRRETPLASPSAGGEATAQRHAESQEVPA